MPTDGTYMWFGMWVPQNVNNFEEAHNFMKSLDTALLTDAVSGQKRADMLNGMPVFYFNATGKKDEELLEYYGMYLQIARDAVAVAIYIDISAILRQPFFTEKS
jgi:hypothetical protein